MVLVQFVLASFYQNVRKSSTRGISRDEVAMSRFSFNHLQICRSSSLIRNNCLRVSSSIIMWAVYGTLLGLPFGTRDKNDTVVSSD
jgi:hypothetical protein